MATPTESAPWFTNAALRCDACGEPAEAGAGHCSACGGPLGAEAAADLPEAGFDCQSCGASVACQPGLSGVRCPFCDSSYVVEWPAADLPRVEPEFVIPFQLTAAQAEDRFRRWLSDALLVPSDIKAQARAEAVRGIYVPFWTFSMRAESTFRASIGEHWYETKVESYTDGQGKRRTRTRTVRHTQWVPFHGRHHGYHFQDLVSGSKGLPQTEADAVAPFDLAALQRYRPAHLAGWLAEAPSVERAVALRQSSERALDAERKRVEEFLPGDTHRDLSVTTAFADVSEDLVLLPYWVYAYRYGDRVYRFVLNGQTGRATGTRPFSPWKAVVLSLVVLALLGGLIAGALLVVNP